MTDENVSKLLAEIQEKRQKLLRIADAQKYSFTTHEIRDITIATITLLFAFSIALNGGFFLFLSFDLSTFLFSLVVSAVAVVAGFIAHELAHKLMAQRYGFKAYFKLWIAGIVIAFVTALIGFIFAAPGAVYIEAEESSKDQIGKIAVVGSIANLIVAGAFLPIYFLTTGILSDFAFYVVFLNGFLAVFNLLWVPPFDGAAVYEWNKKLLYILIAIALVIVGFSYMTIYASIL